MKERERKVRLWKKNEKDAMLLALKTGRGSHMGSFLEAGKGKEKDSPLEPPENNTDPLTP